MSLSIKNDAINFFAAIAQFIRSTGFGVVASMVIKNLGKNTVVDDNLKS